jgi:hypothetical protein
MGICGGTGPSQMVVRVEVLTRVQVARNADSRSLPQKVIWRAPFWFDRLFEGLPGTFGKTQLIPVEVSALGTGSCDRVTVVRRHERPNSMAESVRLGYPVPTHCMFGTVLGRTRVSGIRSFIGSLQFKRRKAQSRSF